MPISCGTIRILRKASLYVVIAALVAVLLGSSRIVSAQTAAPPIAPSISLSANGSTNAQAFQGSALILHASVYHPNLYSRKTLVTPLLINAQNGSWANTIQLSITDSSGAVQHWPVQLIAPTGSLTLDHASAGALSWVLAPSAASSIAPGIYSAIALMDTTASAGNTGWSGATSSYSISIEIDAPPSQPTSAQQEDQAVLLATYDHLLGNSSQSISDLDSFLSQNPGAVRALTVQGQYLEQSGQLDNALSAYGDAIAALYAANPGSDAEAPRELLAAQGRVRSTLLSQTNSRGVPSVQIQLAGQGTQAAGVSFVDLQITNIGTDAAQNVTLNQFALEVLAGSGQVLFNNILSPLLPISTHYLGVNNSSTVRIFLNTQGTVNSVSLTETGSTADIFGTAAPFSQTQTIALNAAGGGGGAPSPLTISAPTVTQVYGQITPPINNVTYSGFASGDGPASLTGALNCVTTGQQGSPAGTYPIICSGLSSPSYVITFIPGTINITPAPLTIVANSATRLFGQPNPQFTANISGFANGDTSAALSGSVTCSSSATPTSSLSGNPYPITCSGVSSPNYAITFAPANLILTQAAPVITWNNPADISQGTALGSQQLNATANVPGTFLYAPPSGTVLLAGSGQLLSVTFRSTDATDYAVASASARINVSTASLLPLTVTPSNATAQYGQPTPAFTNVTYSGFATGDSPASLAGTLSCTSSANSSSPVGTYPITCSGLTSTKYKINFAPGTLTIAQALLTITAVNATRPFGQPNPVFSATLTGLTNGDNLASLSGTLACSSSASSTSPVTGSPYGVTCAGVTSPNYAITFVAGLLAITKATPTITWSNPPGIGLGVALGSAQLNASASVPGQFVYTPPAGTVLAAGNTQTLSVSFTPTDAADYNPARASVTINVTAVVGDLNGDGVVDCADLAIIKAAFGKKSGQTGFDPRADTNGDGIVNVIDLAFVSRRIAAGTVCK